jgi:HK97 family phage portal protein
VTLSTRLARRQEQRNFGTMGAYSGQSIVDPAAIPPPGMSGTTAAGMLVNDQTALTIDVVHTAMHILTSGIIKRRNLRAYVQKIGSAGETLRQWQTTPNPFLENTFSFPGPRSTAQSRGMLQSVVSLALFGEAWWYILTTDRVGNASSVQVLHPLMLNIKKSLSGSVQQFEYGSGTSKVILDPDNLYHLERMSLPSHDRAISNIREASITYGIALAAMAYTSLWFGQGAQPNFLITSDGDISDDVAQRLAQKFRVEHSGVRQFHIPVVTGANVKIQPTGVSADDAQMLQTLEYVRTCIGSMFSIPSHLLGGLADKGNTWGANHEEQSQSMEDFTYGAYVTVLEEAHSDLLPSSVKAAWPNSLVQPNLLNLGNALQFMRQAQVITPNEARSMYLGLGPVPDGDDLIVPLASNVGPEQTTLGTQPESNAATSAEQAEDESGNSPNT